MSDDASKLKKVKIESDVDFSASAVKIDGVELYYSQSGKAELKDTVGLTLWSNGEWTTQAKNRVPNLTRLSLRSSINDGIIKAFKDNGGNANGFILPSWMTDNSEGTNNTLTDEELSDMGIIVPGQTVSDDEGALEV